MPRRRRNRYKFTGKSQSKKGIIATIVAATELFVYFNVISKAAGSEDGLSQYYGSLGCAFIIFSIAAAVIAIQSEMEEESFKIFPHLATFLSLLAVICWAGTYIWGLM